MHYRSLHMSASLKTLRSVVAPYPSGTALKIICHRKQRSDLIEVNFDGHFLKLLSWR